MNRDKKVENYAHLNQSDFGAISLGLSDEYEDMPEHSFKIRNYFSNLLTSVSFGTSFRAPERSSSVIFAAHGDCNTPFVPKPLKIMSFLLIFLLINLRWFLRF